MRSLDRRTRIAIGFAGSLAAGASPSVAGVVSTEPSVTSSFDYSTNPQLRLDGARSGYALVADASAPTAWEDAVRRLALVPRIRTAATGGDSALGRDAYYMDASLGITGERSRWDVGLGWHDEALATAEPAPGTLTRIDERVEAESAQLAWRRSLTERLSASLDGTWTSTRYHSNHAVDQVLLFGYRNSSYGGTLSEALTERMSADIVVGGSRYSLANGGTTTNSTYMQAGLSGTPAPLWHYSLRYGSSESRSGVGGSHTGAVYAANLEHRGERLTLSVAVSQTTQPSGFGVVVSSRDATLNADWAHSERLSFYSALRSGRTENVFQTLSVADRRYLTATAGAVWQWSPVWEVRGEVRWQRQTSGGFLELSRSAAGSGGSLAVSRHFGRIRLAGI